MVPTFRNWLKLRELAVTDVPTQTQIIGAAVGATQLNNPSNVADRMAATNAPLTLAILNSPRGEKVQALANQKNKAKFPGSQSIQNNIVPANVGAAMNPGAPS